MTRPLPANVLLEFGVNYRRNPRKRKQEKENILGESHLLLAFGAARHAISGLILGSFTHPADKGCLDCRFPVYSLLSSKLRCVVKLSFVLTDPHRTPLLPAAPLLGSQFQDLDSPGASWDKARRFPCGPFNPVLLLFSRISTRARTQYPPVDCFQIVLLRW